MKKFFNLINAKTGFVTIIKGDNKSINMWNYKKIT